MKAFSIFALAGLLASASALPQENNPLSPAAKCASECGLNICCQAKCYNVPCPSEDMANKTTQCAMKCPQGNGSPEDIVAYAKCQTDCINTNFFDGSRGIPNPTATGGAGSPGSPNNTGGVSPTGSGSGSPSGSEGAEATGTGSPTGGASASPSAGAAAMNVQFGSSAAGVVGLIMAALAL
ncbi:hypothetical protein AJ78_04538 [Emergomyces pasteurianus Ep9510]|uniref:Extracellular membrane protein CFEM domain-containing protein n=1 Tax=Emergomyces pasteurianus Ep9510 TaxID=1447872 RepID=A0A1J9QG83_9EURO|nr:hypothetical protein AJ78_04538 [Emergomyces pasteurianus Ep9510]